MNKPLCLIVLVLSLGACKPAAPEATTPPTAATPAAEAAPAPTAAVATLAAGTFTGTLPCADCPGIDNTLELAADGRYTLTQAYRERSVEPLRNQGTWTLAADGKRLQLVSDDAGAATLQYEVVSADELRQLDLQGKPIDSTLDFSLRRQGG